MAVYKADRKWNQVRVLNKAVAVNHYMLDIQVTGIVLGRRSTFDKSEYFFYMLKINNLRILK
jgi:hypothetical protein